MAGQTNAAPRTATSRPSGRLPQVREILELPELAAGNPELVAGSAGLGNQVRWVHVSELGDIAPLLSGGELLLTTGIALNTDPQAMIAYVESLAQAGVAGLVIEAGRRFLRPPRALAVAADRLQLPLILLRQEIKFVRVTEQAHRFIIQSQLIELQAYQELDQTFTEMAIEGATAGAIVRQAALLSHRAVLLSTRGHQVLAVEAGELDLNLVLDGWRKTAGKIDMSGQTRSLPAPPGWLVTSVGARGETWALLAMMHPEDVPSDRALGVLDRAAIGLTLNRLVDRDRETLEMQAQRAFLSDLLAGGQTLPMLEARASALGLKLQGAFQGGYVMEALDLEDRTRTRGESGIRDLAQLVATGSRQAGIESLVAPLSARLVAVLVSVPPKAADELILGRLSIAIHRAVSAQGEGAVRISFGSRAGSLREVRRSLVEAEQVLDSLRDPPTKVFYQLLDVRLRGLLHLLRDDPRVEMFCSRELGPLLAEDQGREGVLLRALRAFLEQGGNKSRAAAHLGLSRPTLYARLERVERILGRDLDSVDSRLSLQVALLALDEDPRPS